MHSLVHIILFSLTVKVIPLKYNSLIYILYYKVDIQTSGSTSKKHMTSFSPKFSKTKTSLAMLFIFWVYFILMALYTTTLKRAFCMVPLLLFSLRNCFFKKKPLRYLNLSAEKRNGWALTKLGNCYRVSSSTFPRKKKTNNLESTRQAAPKALFLDFKKDLKHGFLFPKNEKVRNGLQNEQIDGLQMFSNCIISEKSSWHI